MSRPAIVVENLTKVYRIGQAEQRSDTLVGAAVSALKAPARNFRNLYRLGTAGRDEADDTIRAVDDLSFEVQPGEVLGIIGRNGAGKSTLLKILSRVTKPTSGRVVMRGRVSSLLEVGTGFHPELTGRENVYLNGTILGMTKREIDRKFDEIVDFSGVEKFLDTPVKRYSSGMKVRLAFAVAAHLEPEILIIDEVLAVGDQEFQNKCLGKMREVAGGQGRTVLFVSHNLGSVVDLCDRCILMQRGGIVREGDPEAVVSFYTRSDCVKGSEVDLRHWTGERGGDGPMRIARIAMLDAKGRSRATFGYREPIHFVITIIGPAGTRFNLAIAVKSSLGHVLLHCSTLQDRFFPVIDGGPIFINMRILENFLNDGVYSVRAWLGSDRGVTNDVIEGCISFRVDTSNAGRSRSKGVLRLSAQWGVAASAIPGDSWEGAETEIRGEDWRADGN